jgi:hypothetical protein
VNHYYTLVGTPERTNERTNERATDERTTLREQVCASGHGQAHRRQPPPHRRHHLLNRRLWCVHPCPLRLGRATRAPARRALGD